MKGVAKPPEPADFPGFPMHALRDDPEAFTVEQDGKYLHWDELRHRPKRGTLTHPEWWGAIKFARMQASRGFPLKSKEGSPFRFVMTDTVQRLVHEVDRDASGRIELPEDVTNRSTRDRYVVSSLIEEAFRSSQLEGASTTRAVAKEMIRTKREPRTTSERMIYSNFLAMEWVREHKDEPLSADLVFELHSIITRDTLEIADGGGRFRRDDEEIAVYDVREGELVHEPPSAQSLPQRMTALCRFANSEGKGESFTHPVIRAIMLHFWLAYDHPFVDGNGRVARALFYWSMLRQGYWLTEFISISRAIKKSRVQYDRAFVYTETDENDATYFLLNQLKVLRSAIDELFRYLKRKVQEVREVEQLIRGRDDLNNRQLALLGHALRRSDSRFTIEGHQMSHRVVYQTARTDLLGLVERGLLEQFKVGKKLVFAPVRDLSRKLGRPEG
jgi:Fic family protein